MRVWATGGWVVWPLAFLTQWPLWGWPRMATESATSTEFSLNEFAMGSRLRNPMTGYVMDALGRKPGPSTWFQVRSYFKIVKMIYLCAILF